MEDDENTNYDLFRDCLSVRVLQPNRRTPGTKGQKRRKGRLEDSYPPSTSLQDDDDLTDFIDYLALEVFESLPEPLQHLNYRSWRESTGLQSDYSLPLTEDALPETSLPVSVVDTLVSYGLIDTQLRPDSTLPSSATAFFIPVLSSYIEDLTKPPPASPRTRTTSCELCDRSWVPLSYHHLIPRFVHEKVVKRGWHRPEDLQNVAWLCGACHRFVHQFQTHEQLARHFYTVDMLLEADEVRKFTAWVGKLRRKGGRSAPMK